MLLYHDDDDDDEDDDDDYYYYYHNYLCFGHFYLLQPCLQGSLLNL